LHEDIEMRVLEFIDSNGKVEAFVKVHVYELL